MSDVDHDIEIMDVLYILCLLRPKIWAINSTSSVHPKGKGREGGRKSKMMKINTRGKLTNSTCGNQQSGFVGAVYSRYTRNWGVRIQEARIHQY